MQWIRVRAGLKRQDASQHSRGDEPCCIRRDLFYFHTLKVLEYQIRLHKYEQTNACLKNEHMIELVNVCVTLCNLLKNAINPNVDNHILSNACNLELLSFKIHKCIPLAKWIRYAGSWREIPLETWPAMYVILYSILFWSLARIARIFLL